MLFERFFLTDNVGSYYTLIGRITVCRVFLASKFIDTNPMHAIEMIGPLVRRFSQINLISYFKILYMINIYIEFTI